MLNPLRILYLHRVVRGPTVRAALGKSREPVLFDRWVAAAMHSALANKRMMRVTANAGRVARGSLSPAVLADMSFLENFLF